MRSYVIENRVVGNMFVNEVVTRFFYEPGTITSPSTDEEPILEWLAQQGLATIVDGA